MAGLCHHTIRIELIKTQEGKGHADMRARAGAVSFPVFPRSLKRGACVSGGNPAKVSESQDIRLGKLVLQILLSDKTHCTCGDEL